MFSSGIFDSVVSGLDWSEGGKRGDKGEVIFIGELREDEMKGASFRGFSGVGCLLVERTRLEEREGPIVLAGEESEESEEEAEEYLG